MTSTTTTRRTVEQFLSECEQCFRLQRTNPEISIPQPTTGAELDGFCDRWPEKAYLVRPADLWVLESVGLSRNTGRPAEPFAVEWMERFAATLAGDPAFAATVAGLLAPAEGGGQWD